MDDVGWEEEEGAWRFDHDPDEAFVGSGAPGSGGAGGRGGGVLRRMNAAVARWLHSGLVAWAARHQGPSIYWFPVYVVFSFLVAYYVYVDRFKPQLSIPQSFLIAKRSLVVMNPS